MRDFIFVLDLVYAEPGFYPEILDAIHELEGFGVLAFGVSLQVRDVGCWIGARGAQIWLCSVDVITDRVRLLDGGCLSDGAIFMHTLHRRFAFCVGCWGTVSSKTC